MEIQMYNMGLENVSCWKTEQKNWQSTVEPAIKESMGQTAERFTGRYRTGRQKRDMIC